MSELILHHYSGSPYALKIRAILGYKRLAWRSVEIPVAPPRPSLAPILDKFWRTPRAARLPIESASVSALPDDYWRSALEGVLCAVSDRQVTIRVAMEGAMANTARIHLPRLGYEITLQEES